MPRLWPCLLAAALLLSPGCSRSFAGKVVRVIDGDSIVVLREGRPEQVRLNGIDCPERTQAFGSAARQATSELAFGATVSVAVAGRDRFGRTLGDVTLPDGRNLNRELVSAGMAWWFRGHSRDRTLERLEREARAARRGLWAYPAPTPPWEHRRARRHPADQGAGTP